MPAAVGESIVVQRRVYWASLILVVFVLALVVGTSCGLQRFGRASTPSDASLGELPPEFARVAEVWELLSREHFDRERLDADAMSEGAIRGMLQALDDPYASFLNAEQFNVESQDFRGFFEGIGAQVGVSEGQITMHFNPGILIPPGRQCRPP